MANDNSSTSEVYTAQLEALMDCLDVKQLKAAWRSGLRPSAKTIERSVISQLETEHPKAAKYRKEIAIKIWRSGMAYTVGLSKGQLSLQRSKSGKMVEYSHLFILRWLAKGTAERRTQKGYNRGAIVGSHFFYQGVMRSIDPAASRLSGDVMKSFEKAVLKAKQVPVVKKSGQPL